MKFPIKINRSNVPSWISRIVSGKYDPRLLCGATVPVNSFENAISALKINNTWKSTSKNRHLLTNRLILQLLTRHPESSILEIGVSSGIASLELLELINDSFGKLFITDLFLSIPYHSVGKKGFFYHPSTKQCILCATEYLLLYTDCEDALFPFDVIVNNVLNHAPPLDEHSAVKVDLLHPLLRERLRSDNRIQAVEYDVFNPWLHQQVDIIKIANVFNKAYFANEQIVHGIQNVRNALTIGGKLLLTDNRDSEKVTLFSKNQDNTFTVEETVNGGSEITDIVLSL